jgi:hypothetical protein
MVSIISPKVNQIKVTRMRMVETRMRMVETKKPEHHSAHINEQKFEE